MTGNKKVSCKVCYREMRSDHLTRHMKQHSKRNESNPVTNISVTKNYNTTSSVLADREDEVECEAVPHLDIINYILQIILISMTNYMNQCDYLH